MRWISIALVLVMAGVAEAEKAPFHAPPGAPFSPVYTLRVNGDPRPTFVRGQGSGRWLAQASFERVEEDIDSAFFGDRIAEIWIEARDWQVAPFSLDWEDAEIRFESGGQSLRVSVERAGEVVVGDWHDLPELEMGHLADFPNRRSPVIGCCGEEDWRESAWSIEEAAISVVGTGGPDLLFDGIVGGEELTVELLSWRVTAPEGFFPGIPEPSAIVLLALSALGLPGVGARSQWR